MLGQGTDRSNWREEVLLCDPLWIPHKPHRWGRKQNPKLQAARPAKPCGYGQKELLHQPALSLHLQPSCLLHASCLRAGVQGHALEKAGHTCQQFLPFLFLLHLLLHDQLLYCLSTASFPAPRPPTSSKARKTQAERNCVCVYCITWYILIQSASQTLEHTKSE